MEGFDFTRCRQWPHNATPSIVGFAKPGTEVFYVGFNGKEGDRKQILIAGITKDQPLRVKRVIVGNWSSDYVFEGIDGEFNTVCFAERVPPKPSVITKTFDEVYVVSVDDHPTGVFASLEVVFDRFSNLKFEEIGQGLWKALSEDQYNTIYVESFLVQH